MWQQVLRTGTGNSIEGSGVAGASSPWQACDKRHSFTGLLIPGNPAQSSCTHEQVQLRSGIGGGRRDIGSLQHVAGIGATTWHNNLCLRTVESSTISGSCAMFEPALSSAATACGAEAAATTRSPMDKSHADGMMRHIACIQRCFRVGPPLPVRPQRSNTAGLQSLLLAFALAV
jgi:hypothetical protein